MAAKSKRKAKPKSKAKRKTASGAIHKERFPGIRSSRTSDPVLPRFLQADFGKP